LKKCLIENCINKYFAKGYCKLHYQQIYRYGHILEDKKDIVGNIYSSNNNGNFKVLEYKYSDSKNRFYLIAFIETKTQFICTKSRIISGNIKDYNFKSVLGVGYLGDIKPYKYKKFYDVWFAMMDRCYNENCKTYNNYGGKGITVHPDWHCFKIFVDDAVNIIGYDEIKFKNNELQLDKDLLQNDIAFNKKLYSKTTCMWLENAINASIKPSQQRKFKAISPTGEVFFDDNQRKFSKEHRITFINKYLTKQRKNKNGWQFEYID